jgi:hypothetical protein
MGLRALPELIVLLVLLPACRAEEPREEKPVPKNLILLRNEHVEVGIFPQLGGRIVLLKRAGGQNVLQDAHAELLDTPEEKLPKPSAGGAWAGEGHIVWIGPQKDWWRNQDLNASRKKQGAGWPPDPWIECGRFEVTEKDQRHVKMTGPASPITGLQLTKEIALEEKLVRFTVTAKNTRDAEVSWDLWTNTRLPAHARGFAPAKKDECLKFEFISGQMATERPLELRYANGFAYFEVPADLPDGVNAMRAKFFLKSRAAVAAGFWKDTVLIKRSVASPPETQVHPDQASVEIYQALTRDGKVSLLELEFHGAYVKLAPGAEMSFAETWELLPYDGANTPEAQAEFLSGAVK